MKRILCLTSIPPRFAQLPRVLDSLLRQSADAVLLTLPEHYDRFPGPISLPTLPKGVTLMRSALDMGPATKLIPALRTHPDATLILCDDDCLYGPDWLGHLLSAAQSGTAVTGAGWSVDRLQRVGAPRPFSDIAQGFSGTLLPPHSLSDEVHNAPNCAWSVDDIWISGMLAVQGTRLISAPKARTEVTPLTAPDPLQQATIRGLSRGAANRATADYLSDRFGIWPRRKAAPA